MTRSLVSQIIAILFIILSTTGILMYIRPFKQGITLLHISTGILFSIAILFHLFNNIRALSKYITAEKSNRFYLNPSTVLLLFGALLLSALAWFNLPPLKQVYAFSQSLKGGSALYYQVLETNTELQGKQIQLEVRMGKPSHTPTLAAWVEDQHGNYLQDLYVSQKLAKEDFINFEHKRRPEALPVWSHKRGIQAKDGLYVPDKNQAIPDGLSGATPTSNWVLNSQLNSSGLDSVRVFLEINQSFDWNEFYHPAAFQDDPVYSGPGKVGQPALVYGTEVLALQNSSITQMHLLGRAHHSGKDGLIRQELEHITTALDMVERILVVVP